MATWHTDRSVDNLNIIVAEINQPICLGAPLSFSSKDVVATELKNTIIIVFGHAWY